MTIDLLKEKEDLLLSGYVIVDDAISNEHLTMLHENMIEETKQMIQSKKWGGVGALPGHLQQNPPRFSPYVFRDIISNPVVIKITKSILGKGLYNDFYSANINCPGSIAQPVHRDCSSLWADNKVSHPPISLVVNIPLVDVDEFNGSMEIWPGSHRILEVKKYIPENTLYKRRKILPPIRANMRKGSILIRDVRTWHRGMPNFSKNPRHMIAMIHRIHWFQRGERIPFSKNCEDEMRDVDLEHHVYFTEESIDHSIDPTYGAYSVTE